MKETPLERWPAALEGALARSPRFLRSVRVVAETLSTQDVARDLGLPAGLVVVAGRQRGGRGREGRSWADTGEEGIALTAVIPIASKEPSERLVLAGALAALRAVERVADLAVGVKWPNDLVLRGRKLAGILIERTGDRAAFGIGINVRQRSFPGHLADLATSLALEGREVDRLDLLVHLLPELDAALAEPLADLERSFLARDALRGAEASFATPHGEVEGKVLEVRPMEGLLVRVEGGTLLLPAATTSIRRWKPAG